MTSSETRPALDQALAFLRCPKCGKELTRGTDGVECAAGHAYAQHDGYLDFSDAPRDDATARTFESFGYEWTTFDEPEADDSVSADVYFADVDPAMLRAGAALDAGCGRGRFTARIADHAPLALALDGSEAVRSAARNLAGRDNVVVVRGDLRQPPIAPASLSFVASLGVLHHLEDPSEGLRALSALLEPHGRMLVYVYSAAEKRGVRATALRSARALRHLTVHVPHRLLRALCVPLSAVLYATFVIPGRIGQRLRFRPLAGLPLDVYRRLGWRALWLDTFDRLSAPIEHRFRRDQLEPWFAGAGLNVDRVREEAGYYVLGTRAST